MYPPLACLQVYLPLVNIQVHPLSATSQAYAFPSDLQACPFLSLNPDQADSYFRSSTGLRQALALHVKLLKLSHDVSPPQREVC